jgi:hypothetical protein
VPNTDFPLVLGRRGSEAILPGYSTITNSKQIRLVVNVRSFPCCVPYCQASRSIARTQSRHSIRLIGIENALNDSRGSSPLGSRAFDCRRNQPLVIRT